MMTIDEMRRIKQTLGYTNEMLADKSGVPVSTVRKVMAGLTKSPRLATLEALEEALRSGAQGSTYPDSPYQSTAYPGSSPSGSPNHSPAYQPPGSGKPPALHESAAYHVQQRLYTIDDIYNLPDGVRAELIDGKLYYMASPTRTHQKIAGELYYAVAGYIKSRGGKCEVYIPPFGVFLNADDSIYVEPDLTVVCDTDKLEERGCVGAPDWVVEVVSPSSGRMDGLIKLNKYKAAGVREYWLIYPEKRIVMVYDFEGEGDVRMYSFDENIPGHIFPDFSICLADFV